VSKVALISGATSGIGAATARRLGSEGASVACLGRNRSKGEQIVSDIESFSSKACFIPTDVTRSNQVAAAVERTINTFGKIDILFNGAGVQLVRSCTDMTEEEWDNVIDTNLKATFLVTKYAMPWLRQTRGVVINTASELGIIGAPKYSAYCASKGGVILLTRALALECAPFDVRVNCVSPGATQTAMLEGEVDYYTKNETQSFPDKETAMKFLLDMIPLHRIATPEEIAGVVAFLASEEAAYMTGAVVPVDAGTTAK
jgi:NAD(P)-dependent dehydrogenase (short-subunit alcohol dehydrogenase family)